MGRYAVPKDRLESGFADKAPLLTKGEASFEANRCLYCHDAPCIKSCPTSIDIATFIRKIATGNLRGAARTILSANLLGASCARVCPVEVLCESTCVYTRQGRDAIPIGRLQRYAVEHGAAVDLFEKAPPNGRSVGLVGAGPASLACAGTLALLGYEAVVYERSGFPGGLNATGVAPYKLKLEDNLDEVGFIEALGVEIRTRIEVGVDVAAEELLERHDAVFLGPGLGGDAKLGVPGEDGDGVFGAVAWIRELKMRPGLALAGVRDAIVVGGGNTAIDVTRELAGLGVRSVTLVYRRRRADMSGYEHELSAALDAGVYLLASATVAAVERENGRVARVRLVATDGGRPTDRELGVRRADLVVVAIGQSKLRALVAQFEDVSCDPRGRIVADPETFVTGNPRVFAGGDARNGGKEVVNAVYEGQRAARSIDALVRSRVEERADA